MTDFFESYAGKGREGQLGIMPKNRFQVLLATCYLPLTIYLLSTHYVVSPVRFQAARAYLLVTTYCSLLTTYCSLLTTRQAAMTDMFKGTAIQMRTLDLIATTYGTGDPDPREPGKLYSLWLHLLWLYLLSPRLLSLRLLSLRLLWPDPV